MPQPPLLDRAVLDDLFVQIGDEGARAVLGLFIEETRTYLATIVEAVGQPADPARRDQARRAAHSLKSGAGQIGAAAVAEAAAAVEAVATIDSADLGIATATLAGLVEQTAAAITRRLAEPSPPA